MDTHPSRTAEVMHMEGSINQSEDQSPSNCMLLLPICWALSQGQGEGLLAAGGRNNALVIYCGIYLSAVTLDGSNRTDIF